MKKFLLLPFFLLATVAQADDHRSQWAAGGGLGANFAAPWAKSNFTSKVDPKLPRAGAWLRYNYGSPEISWELSYNYLTLAKQNIRTHAVIFQWISRMLPDSILHPHFGFGIGWSKSENYFQTGIYETPIFQLRAGVDYALERNTDISLYVDHFTVFRNFPNEPNMNVLAPTLALTHYFGESALPKAETKPAAESAPAATSSPAATAPALSPSTSEQPNLNAFSPSKAKKKRKKRRKQLPGHPSDANLP